MKFFSISSIFRCFFYYEMIDMVKVYRLMMCLFPEEWIFRFWNLNSSYFRSILDFCQIKANMLRGYQDNNFLSSHWKGALCHRVELEVFYHLFHYLIRYECSSRLKSAHFTSLYLINVLNIVFNGVSACKISEMSSLKHLDFSLLDSNT